MKILNKQKLEEMHLIIDQILVCKILLFFTNCTANPYYFSVIDATLTSDNPSCFRDNLLEKYKN